MLNILTTTFEAKSEVITLAAEELEDEILRGRSSPYHIKQQPGQQKTNEKPATLAEWTILILVQASNDLESFAYKNIREIMRWGSSPQVNVLVDLHKTGNKAWKYKIEKGYCVVEEVSPRSPQSTIAEEVISSAQWAITNYPAKHYAFVFWNHGSGCLKVDYEEVYMPNYMKQNQGHWRTELTNQPEASDLLPTRNEQTRQLSRASKGIIPTDRGILFDDQRRKYLSIAELKQTLATITTQFLGGKKIDIIGMDACYMSMIEVAYQIQPYADYFIASEEFELAYGWPYGAIIEQLVANPTMSGRDLGKLIVTLFEAAYQPRTSYYTQSCTDLSKLEPIKQNLDLLAALLNSVKKQDPVRMRLFIQQARYQALSFSITDFLDIHSFYSELLKLTQYTLDNQVSRGIPTPRVDADSLRKIKVLTTDGLACLKEAVVANTAGRYLSKAGGLSVYYPHRHIDNSYAETEFAKDSSWPMLIVDQVMHHR